VTKRFSNRFFLWFHHVCQCFSSSRCRLNFAADIEVVSSWAEWSFVDRSLTTALLRSVRHIKQEAQLRRRTARRAMLENSCYVSRGMGVGKVSNSKSDLRGHSRALAMVQFDRPHHIRFPIRLSLQICLYLAPLSRYYHLFPIVFFSD